MHEDRKTTGDGKTDGNGKMGGDGKTYGDGKRLVTASEWKTGKVGGRGKTARGLNTAGWMQPGKTDEDADDKGR